MNKERQRNISSLISGTTKHLNNAPARFVGIQRHQNTSTPHIEVQMNQNFQNVASFHFPSLHIFQHHDVYHFSDRSELSARVNVLC